jgi:hypothetical protein
MRINEIVESQTTDVQGKLIALGFDLGPTGADGKMGPLTRKAVTAYQQQNNLQVDGKIGPETLGSLSLSNNTAKPKPTNPADGDRTVCIFKGMSHGQAGNSACDAIAEATGGKTWGPLQTVQAAAAAAESARAYWRSRPGTKLIVMGYSMGASSLLAIQSARPLLTVSVAGWSTVVEALDRAAKGEYHNFYDPAELNGQLAKQGRKYTSTGGQAHELNLGPNTHSLIVPQVAGQIIRLINQA